MLYLCLLMGNMLTKPMNETQQRITQAVRMATQTSLKAGFVLGFLAAVLVYFAYRVLFQDKSNEN